jgi:hypothetical protein
MHRRHRQRRRLPAWMRGRCKLVRFPAGWVGECQACEFSAAQWNATATRRDQGLITCCLQGSLPQLCGCQLPPPTCTTSAARVTHTMRWVGDWHRHTARQCAGLWCHRKQHKSPPQAQHHTCRSAQPPTPIPSNACMHATM